MHAFIHNIVSSKLSIWIKTKDELYRQINIHVNKRKNIRKAVNADIDTEIYTWFKHNRGNNIPLSGNTTCYVVDCLIIPHFGNPLTHFNSQLASHVLFA